MIVTHMPSIILILRIGSTAWHPQIAVDVRKRSRVPALGAVILLQDLLMPLIASL